LVQVELRISVAQARGCAVSLFRSKTLSPRTRARVVGFLPTAGSESYAA